MIVSPSVSSFLESINTGKRVTIPSFFPTIFPAFSKNSSHCMLSVQSQTISATNNLAWSLLKERFPERFFQGCASRCLHLPVKNIFCVTKMKRGQNAATYPDDYTLEYLLAFVAECKELV
jgi:hypothetical protein